MRSTCPGVRTADQFSSGATTTSCTTLFSTLASLQGVAPGAESVAECLAQVLTLGLPPLMQDRDVGADGEVPDAHVEEVLRLIRGGDLGAGRHAHLDGRFEHAALHHSELRRVALAGPSDAHRVVGAAPVHHVDTLDGQDVLERV